MAREIPEDLLPEFFTKMAAITNISQSFQEVFESISLPLSLGRVKIVFHEKNTGRSAGAESVYELFESAKSFHSDVYQNYQFQMPDGSFADVIMYSFPTCEQWAMRQLSALAGIAQYTFIFVSRLKLQQDLFDSALIDSMTHLPNTIAAMRFGNQQLAKNSLSNYHLVFINLKNYKQVNQQYSTSVGDQGLAKTALYLKGLLLPEEMLARLGGDNFLAYILDDHVDTFIKKASSFEVRLMNYMGEEILLTISCCFGIFNITEADRNIGKILDSAHSALIIGKRTTHETVSYYSKEQAEKMQKYHSASQDFEKHMNANDFLVYYQPKVSLEDYSLIGCEALVRLRSGNDVLLPGAFIPALEETGKIVALDFFVLTQVCSDLSKWILQGYNPPLVSVNFSMKHLSDELLVDRVMDILEKYDIDPSYIEIEFTETAAITDYTRLKQVVAELRAYGLTTSIDDFGSGFSSLQMLKDFHVDIIKLDRSFLLSQNNDLKKNQIILENMIRMAYELGIDVITEGVETASQADMLKDLGCMMVQGYLFDHPLCRDDFEDRLAIGQYSDPDTMNE